ncbi:helix-turn-helix domain-containing protein [Streptomyces sp. BA2]|uniref:helix-turn-helix domain-containing protein n=1 Tax=Streptomyces sp. BA2 TaxID=436595 RepID=UPI00136804B4|nr:NB-ARC domain-containing protein [Streptomyces sp. BA2]
MPAGTGAAGHPSDGGPREAAADVGPVDSVDTADALAVLLRQLRRRAARRDGGAQITYRQLAARTGWAHGVIGDYFAGKTLPPTDRFDTLVQLLGATGRELRLLATARDRVEEARRSRPATNGRTGPPGTDGAGSSPPVPRHPPVPRQLPADIPELPGREREMAELDVLGPAPRGKGPLVVALDGPGGVGKSALAVHAGHRLGERFPDGQLYADLRGSRRDEHPVPPDVVLRRFLCALGASGPYPDSVADAAAAYRTLLTERRVLIVLDNALDAAQVRPLLPAAHGCAVLVTSRGVLAALNGAVHLHLMPLPPAASVEVLGLWAGAGRLTAERAAAEAIAHHCDHLPLALRIAGARLAARPRWPVRELADRLADPERRLAELSFADLDMYAALEAGHRELLARGPTGRVAALALPLLAAEQGELTVPEAAAATGEEPSTTEVILEQLVDVQFLESRAPGRYRFHPLTRLFALRSLTRERGV